MNLDKIKSTIQSVLSDDLLKPVYKNIKDKHHTTGHCYAASEAALHILGGREVWMACCGRDSTGGTHWWLKHKQTKEIFNITSEQYTFFGLTPPYENGKPCSFLTKNPSKRAQVIMNRLMDLQLLEKI